MRLRWIIISAVIAALIAFVAVPFVHPSYYYYHDAVIWIEEENRGQSSLIAVFLAWRELGRQVRGRDGPAVAT